MGEVIGRKIRVGKCGDGKGWGKRGRVKDGKKGEGYGWEEGDG